MLPEARTEFLYAIYLLLVFKVLKLKISWLLYSHSPI